MLQTKVKERFKVKGNCIVDGRDAILYDHLDEIGITRAQAKKLARIHSDNPDIDFETAFSLIK